MAFTHLNTAVPDLSVELQLPLGFCCGAGAGVGCGGAGCCVSVSLLAAGLDWVGGGLEVRPGSLPLGTGRVGY